MLAPAMVSMMHECTGDDEQYPHVASVGMTGSMPMPYHHAVLTQIFPKAEITTNFGATEAAPAGTSRSYDPDQPLNVGWPRQGCAVRITTESGEQAVCGQVGVVWLSALGAPTRRYLHQELNAKHFDGPWVRTGDLGYLKHDGSLVLAGRVTQIISVGGRKVSPDEVETYLSRHPRVKDVSVYALPHRILGEQVAARVVAEGVTAADLKRFARGGLAPFKVPVHIEFFDALTRNPMGKAVREATGSN